MRGNVRSKHLDQKGLYVQNWLRIFLILERAMVGAVAVKQELARVGVKPEPAMLEVKQEPAMPAMLEVKQEPAMVENGA